MKSLVRALVLLLAFPLLASAETGVAGEWKGSYPTQDGEQGVIMALTVRDAEISGSVIVVGAGEFSIRDGVQTDAALNFTTVRSEGESQMFVKWAGVVSADMIVFTLTSDDLVVPQTVVVSRPLQN